MGRPLGYKISEETKEKIRQARIGVKMSDETKELLSEKNTAFWASLEGKRKRRELSKRFKGGTITEEARQKIVVAANLRVCKARLFDEILSKASSMENDVCEINEKE